MVSLGPQPGARIGPSSCRSLPAARAVEPPTPIDDLPTWLQGNWQWFDRSHAHPILWPGGGYRPDLDIQIPGCGTNQAAVLADANRLTNLELHRLPIEQVASLEREFNLFITTGVLHQLADPVVGMEALAQRHGPDVALAVMVYAKYGRLSVDMMQSAFSDMGLVEDERSIRLVAGLPREKQWSVMERLNWRNACHFFMACRTDRPP